jgi:hypothetical protein
VLHFAIQSKFLFSGLSILWDYVKVQISRGDNIFYQYCWGESVYIDLDLNLLRCI